MESLTIPPGVARRAMRSARARARHDGPDARPAIVAESVRQKYDPQRVYPPEDWLAIGRAAVECVNVARQLMLLDPVGGEG